MFSSNLLCHRIVWAICADRVIIDDETPGCTVVAYEMIPDWRWKLELKPIQWSQKTVSGCCIARLTETHRMQCKTRPTDCLRTMRAASIEGMHGHQSAERKKSATSREYKLRNIFSLFFIFDFKKWIFSGRNWKRRNDRRSTIFRAEKEFHSNWMSNGTMDSWKKWHDMNSK